MNSKRLWTGALLLTVLANPAWAEKDKVQRKVGPDGVPVISIKGAKPAPTAKPAAKTEDPAVSRKAWKVYDLDGDEAREDSKPTVVVVSSPPPIAPNNGGYGYGFGFGNGYGYDAGFYNPGYGFGFPYAGNYFVGTGFYSNYQNRPVNYQNPPVNYRPYSGAHNGYRSRCR